MEWETFIICNKEQCDEYDSINMANINNQSAFNRYFGQAYLWSTVMKMK